MPLTQKTIIETLHTFFLNHEEITTLYLFGSWAKNHASPPQDIDVGILLSETAKKTDSLPQNSLNLWLLYREALQQHFTQEIDLTILNNANPLLKQQVFFHGIRVGLRNKSAYLAFRMKSYQEQFDMIHIQQQMHQLQKTSSDQPFHDNEDHSKVISKHSTKV